jgi:hypothetical protein
LLELLGAAFCELISELLVEVELLGAAAPELGAAALFCALISELLVEVELLGAAALELGAAALFCALISELLVELVLLLGGVLLCELMLPCVPTPLELAASEGVAVEGGVFWVWAAELP